ncbi:MAG: metallophosphoesterase family protein [Bacteroidales bacterium]|nr:metallophosphoesterase family protein [Bacteroidales bacterium]
MGGRLYKWTIEEAKNVFFTSDTHFGHENILKYCSRPFADINEHDEELIRRWNEKVPEDGTVFHLGDVGFCSNKRMNEILEQLHGKIYLIIGNHDWRRITEQHKWRFEEMTQQMSIMIGKHSIILNHYPLLTYAGVWKGQQATWNLFGHVHTSPYTAQGLDHQRLNVLFPTQYDVGVDNNDFTPVSFEEVQQIITNQMMSLGMCRNKK